MNRLASLRYSFLILSSSVLLGQGNSEPHPCGSAVRHNLPENFSVLIDSGGGPARIRFRSPNAAVDIEFPGVTDAFQEACQVPDHRLLVFGVAGGVYHVGIVDNQNGLLVDNFYGYSVAVSPDGRWLIMRRFYPPHGGVDFSEQYFIYDIRKSPAENRSAYADDPALGDATGTLVYPVEEKGRAYDRVSLPDKDMHSFWSRDFYWSADSKAAVFADATEAGVSSVLVSISASSSSTYLHSVLASDVCSAPNKVQLRSFMLSGAQFTKSQNGSYDIAMHFSAGGPVPGCEPKTMLINSGEFEQAVPEKHPPKPQPPKLILVPKPK